MTQQTETTGRDLTITRMINAPLHLVFEAWTNPKHVKQWWGPKGFTNPLCEWDPTPGGNIRIDMKAPDGIIYPMDGKFIENKKNEKLVFMSAAMDVKGKHLFDIRNTILFEKDGNKTKLTMQANVLNIKPEAKPYLDGMNEGWNQSLDKLEEYMITL